MRELTWDGFRNARDLGGMPTPLAAGGTTRMGRIARGPRRELLTQTGWREAAHWGLRSIVDLRCADEAGARESDPAAEPPQDLSITAAPTEDHDDPEFREVCFPILDSPEYWQHNVRISPHLIRAALDAIARSEPGVLVHCSAGRDRTGMITAILLANAGVGASDIVADYEASVRAMAGSGAPGAPTHDRQASWSPAEVSQWLSDVTAHVRAFVGAPDRLMDSIGVDHETTQRLRALLVD